MLSCLGLKLKRNRKLMKVSKRETVRKTIATFPSYSGCQSLLSIFVCELCPVSGLSLMIKAVHFVRLQPLAIYFNHNICFVEMLSASDQLKKTPFKLLKSRQVIVFFLPFKIMTQLVIFLIWLF